MFLKNKNIIFKIRRSKVTDYAALKEHGQNGVFSYCTFRRCEEDLTCLAREVFCFVCYFDLQLT